MQNRSVFLTIFLTIVISTICFPKGSLFIVGGRLSMELTANIVELAGGDSSRIIIIPNASGDPLNAAREMKKDLETCGAGSVDYIICSRENADEDSILRKFDGATGIYFSGGDQSRLTDAFVGTKFLQKMKDMYETGVLISGNSAGAAVMSEIMITGNEILNPDADRAFSTIQKGNIETVRGFGFVTKAIIDQHFAARKRHNRLISVVLEHPSIVGIGIDEATAIWVKPDDTFEVFGKSSVIIYDATEAANISMNAEGYLTGTDLKLHVLIARDKFNLNTKKLVQ
jgi:cyanophycinase